MKIKKFIIPFIILSTVGTLMHFVYDWTGKNALVGAFVPINESVWEHLKMVFFPTLIWCTVDYISNPYRKSNEIFASAFSIFLGTFSIVALFYIYTGILGYNLMFIDISLFFIAIIIFLASRDFALKNIIYEGKIINIFSALFLLLMAAAFIVFSYYPPKIGLFISPD